MSWAFSFQRKSLLAERPSRIKEEGRQRIRCGKRAVETDKRSVPWTHFYVGCNKIKLWAIEATTRAADGTGWPFSLATTFFTLICTGGQVFMMSKVQCLICSENCTIEGEGEKREGVQISKLSTQSIWHQKCLDPCTLAAVTAFLDQQNQITTTPELELWHHLTTHQSIPRDLLSPSLGSWDSDLRHPDSSNKMSYQKSPKKSKKFSDK